jgi:phosphoenolpyruvate carboxykinase (ATP)
MCHWGPVNKPIDEAKFDALHKDMMAYLQDKELFVLDAWGGTDPKYKMPDPGGERVRVAQPVRAEHVPSRERPGEAPGASARVHGDRCSEIQGRPGEARHALRVLHPGALRPQDGPHRRHPLRGEIKKSIFSILNYTLPLQGVLSMHCSANIGAGGDTALFFGLSGTGKTTLSSDPDRQLIGDDEHGWSDTGVFNFEGGCYAKVIKLSKEAEPQIYETTRRFGTVLENVVIDPELRTLDLDDASLTENTRSSYPITFIDNAELSGLGGHPTNVVMLTADAYGVLPPIARLTPEGAMYHYLSGYTAKVAGTEKGVTEPKATFSTCFGAPFLPLNPNVYAKMLGEKIAKHKAKVWLVNTGLDRRPYGVGSRMKIAHTRAMITAALTGKLDNATYTNPPGVQPRRADLGAGRARRRARPAQHLARRGKYDEQAKKLAQMFATTSRPSKATSRRR